MAKRKAKKAAKKKAPNRAKKAARKQKQEEDGRPKRTKAEVISIRGKVALKLLKAVNDQQMLGGLWKGEVEDDTLCGIYQGRATVTGDYGPQEQLSISTADGETAFFVPAHHLETVTALKLKKGHTIAIQYKGEGKGTKKGNPAKLYAFASSK